VFRDRTTFRSVIVLTIALVFAQIGALAHAYSHLKSNAGNPDRAALHTSLCGDCANFGAVLMPAGASAACVLLPIRPVCVCVDPQSTALASNATRHYFQAQGPPTLR
jgi:hypothetical protein